MYEVLIPAVGMGVTEVEITNWNVKVGDVVKKGDPIVEIEMEKASSTLEATENGIIKEILYEVGNIVEVGTVICKIEKQ